MKIQAAVARASRTPLRIETVELDGPKAREVLVELRATGICHTDDFTLSGADPEGIFPSILGHEGAGVVLEVGHGVASVAPATTSSRSTHRSAAPASRACRGRRTSAPRFAPPKGRGSCRTGR